MTARAALALFARPVVAGHVKTRLIPALGPERAAALYAAFLRDTVRCVEQAACMQPTLWVAGDPHHASLSALALPRAVQPAGSLGERIAAALDAATQNGRPACALGSDSPTLPPAYLSLACSLLAHGDVVLGPTADGGYYLIGVRAGLRVNWATLLSGVRWSSAHALADTLELTARAGLRARLLPPWYDVDEASDLALLKLHLSLAPGLAPATRALLLTPEMTC